MILFIFFVIVLLGSIVLAQSALVWLIAYMLAPAGRDVSLWRGILIGVAVAVLNICISSIPPIAGTGWDTLMACVVSFAVIWAGFRLTFWRTLLVMIFEATILLLGVYFLVLRE